MTGPEKTDAARISYFEHRDRRRWMGEIAPVQDAFEEPAVNEPWDREQRAKPVLWGCIPGAGASILLWGVIYLIICAARHVLP